MVRKKGEMPQVLREKMLGGVGSVEYLKMCEQEETQSHSRLMAVIRIEQGDSIGYHQHDGEEELFYILSGKGEYCEDGIMYQLEPGDAALLRNRQSHGLVNHHAEPLEFIAIVFTDIPTE